MKRFRGCLMVAFIFGCGLLVGAFAGAALGWVGFFHKVVRGGPGAVTEVVIDRAVHDLKLKPEQRTRVRAIIMETDGEIRTATADTAPRVEAIIGHAAERIDAELNPEQRRKFDTFATQVRRRWQTAVDAPGPATTPAPGL